MDMDDVLIKISEVLTIIHESGFKGMVEISSDSCYSGKLAFAAKEFWEEEDGYNKGLSFEGLKVSCSTHKSRKAVWGCFRNMRKASQKKGISEEKAKKIQVQYEEKFGLTMFEGRIENPKQAKKSLYAIEEYYPKGCKPTKDEFLMRFWNDTSEEVMETEWNKFSDEYLS